MLLTFELLYCLYWRSPFQCLLEEVLHLCPGYDYKAVCSQLWGIYAGTARQRTDSCVRWARKLLKVASSTLEVLFDDGKDLIRRKSWMHSGCSPSVVVNSWWKLLLSIRQRFTKTLRAPLSFISNWISWNESHRLSSRQSFVFSSVCFMHPNTAALFCSGSCLFLHAGHRGKPVQWEVGVSSSVSDRNICPGGVARGWVSRGGGDYSVFVRASHPTRPPAVEQTLLAMNFYRLICSLHLFIIYFLSEQIMLAARNGLNGCEVKSQTLETCNKLQSRSFYLHLYTTFQKFGSVSWRLTQEILRWNIKKWKIFFSKAALNWSKAAVKTFML